MSAYEILAHPGGTGQSNFGTVSGLLESVKWHDPKLATTTHAILGRTPQQKQLTTWICRKVHDLRSDFLHGNDVDGAAPLLNGKPVIDFAACLYRLALTGPRAVRELDAGSVDRAHRPGGLFLSRGSRTAFHLSHDAGVDLRQKFVRSLHLKGIWDPDFFPALSARLNFGECLRLTGRENQAKCQNRGECKFEHKTLLTEIAPTCRGEHFVARSSTGVFASVSGIPPGFAGVAVEV